MNSNANEKFNAAGDRPLGAAKPVDPATRLSELLAQSLEELTRPFDPPKVDPLTRVPPEAPRSEPVVPFQPMPARPRQVSPPVAPPPAPPPVQVAPESPPVTSTSRLDDKALAELEAELFAAAASKPARETARQTSAPPPSPFVAAPPPSPFVHPEPPSKPAEEEKAKGPVDLDEVAAATADAVGDASKPPAEEPKALRDEPVVDPFLDRVEQATPAEVATPAPLEPEAVPPTAPSDADAAQVLAKVRRLMIITLAVTFIAVASLAGFIGYRVFKGEGSSSKTADKLPAPPAAGTEMTLSLPRGARILQSAVAQDRLLITIDIGGKVEVRTFDLKTLQPAARLTFSTTP